MQPTCDVRLDAALIGETTKFLDRDDKLPMAWDSWCLTLGEAFDIDDSYVNQTLTEHGVRALAKETHVSQGVNRNDSVMD